MLTCVCCGLWSVEEIWLDRGAGPRRVWRLWHTMPRGRFAFDFSTVDALAVELVRRGIRMW